MLSALEQHLYQRIRQNNLSTEPVGSRSAIFCLRVPNSLLPKLFFLLCPSLFKPEAEQECFRCYRLWNTASSS